MIRTTVGRVTLKTVKLVDEILRLRGLASSRSVSGASSSETKPTDKPPTVSTNASVSSSASVSAVS